MNDRLKNLKFGFVGAGDMGLLYAKSLRNLGVEVVVSDLSNRLKEIEKDLKSHRIGIAKSNVDLLSQADVVFFSLPLGVTENLIQELSLNLKQNAIVGSQSALQASESDTFLKCLRSDVSVLSFHALHGPNVGPKGQGIILTPVRCPEESVVQFESLFEELGVNTVRASSPDEHDDLMADIQAITHVAYESMGSAWMRRRTYPWQNMGYRGGIDNIKSLMVLRIISGKPHVYCDLAMKNPKVKEHVQSYSNVVRSLFERSQSDELEPLLSELEEIREWFLNQSSNRPELILNDQVLGPHALDSAKSRSLPNTHLSLLSMAMTWFREGSNPYQSVVLQTPPYRFRLGIVEYLLKSEEIWKSAIAALSDPKHLYLDDDLEFVESVERWAEWIVSGDSESYLREFDRLIQFFGKENLDQASDRSAELIELLYI